MRRTMERRTRKLITSGELEEVPDGAPGGHSPFATHLLEIFGGESRS